tara:strand:+ start:752 stop:1138 length:387 start_codon:yes stop_codon:yes gene_type:complete
MIIIFKKSFQYFCQYDFFFLYSYNKRFGEKMNIEITARKFTPSSDLKSFINDKLLYLLKFDSNIDFAKVVLLKESRAEKVELIISSKNNRYVTKCYSSVFEKTVVNAIDNIKVQIRKKTANKKSHHLK